MVQAQEQKIPVYKANVGCLSMFLTPMFYTVVMGVVNTINMSGTEKKIEEIKRIEGARGYLPFEIYGVDGEMGRAEADAKSVYDETEGDEEKRDEVDLPRHVIEGLYLKVSAFYVHFVRSLLWIW